MSILDLTPYIRPDPLYETKIEYSADNTNWDHSHDYTIDANVGKGLEFSLETRYIRISYTL